MHSIRQLLNTKGHKVWTVSPNASVYDAIALMAEKEIGAVLIMEGSHVAGILSERDYARKVILAGRSSRETKVSEIMTTRVYHAQPHQNIEECMAVMTEKRIRHLPVLDNGILIGMISIGDLVKAIIATQQFMITQLETYIAS
ncbi:MAG: CBS domain-containing protein [Gammaproteobacteria bacterium]|nr:CBS domain-containing protein [Gammaproteobacteria bacterium]MBI5615025.1 CBS domain-containing protein [Gammaproteobacteria bacterium]